MCTWFDRPPRRYVSLCWLLATQPGTVVVYYKSSNRRPRAKTRTAYREVGCWDGVHGKPVPLTPGGPGAEMLNQVAAP